MTPATDLATNAPSRRRRAWAALALGLATAGPGCARMQSLRPSRAIPPMLGMRSAPATPAAPDLYAQNLSRGMAASEAALAEARQRDAAASFAGRVDQAEVAVRSTRPAPEPAPGPDPAGALAIPPPSEMASGPPLDAPGSLPAEAPAAAESPVQAARALVAAGLERLRPVRSYQVKIHRQERVGDTLQPEEDILLSIRRDPQAVRIEWPDGPHKGREVIYTAADPNLMHVRMADSPIPLPPLKLPLDSPRVKASSRHPIPEAGLEPILVKLASALDAAERDGSGQVAVGGVETPAGLDRPCRKVTRVDPEGEAWTVYLDAETNLPALVQADTPGGELLERYIFRDVQVDLPELATTAAFSPAERWKSGGGLFNRLARSNNGPDSGDSARTAAQ